MRFLLDVNLLLALGLGEHEHHRKAAEWARAHRRDEFLTCAITEIGFVRIAAQAAAYGYKVADAKEILRSLRNAAAPRFRFVEDAVPIEGLPDWVRGARQVTDGHLAAVAAAHGAKLATFDAGIAEAYRIR